jgi:hypothetical protein
MGEMMASILRIALMLSLVATLGSQNKPTSIPEATAAAQANLRTPEGKAYDQKFGAEFMPKHFASLSQCKETAASDPRSFWILLKLDKDGVATEVLVTPSTKMSTCAQKALLKDKFPAPPRPGYWAAINIKPSPHPK